MGLFTVAIGGGGERVQHRLQRLARIAPREHLLLDEPDGFSTLEAPLAVIARGGSHGAGAHPRERLGERVRVPLHRALGRECDGRGETGLLAGGGGDVHLLVRQLGRVSAAMITFALLVSSTTSSVGTLWMPANRSYVEGLSVGPPSIVCTPSSWNSWRSPSPLTTATAAHRTCTPSEASLPAPSGSAPSAPRRPSRSATCARMSATSRCETVPELSNTAVASSG